jgi:hypothetical protein
MAGSSKRTLPVVVESVFLRETGVELSLRVDTSYALVGVRKMGD